MKIAVYGLWHLGSVTAACLADAGHQVTGIDPDQDVVAKLQTGKPPILEPGLPEMVAGAIAKGRLTFTTDPRRAFGDAELVWVAFDTPVDENDIADVAYVVKKTEEIFAALPDDVVVVFSSQLPVGTVSAIEKSFHAARPGKQAHFAYIPENLRLGKAIEVFTKPDRYVVGASSDTARNRIKLALAPITDKLEMVSVASAEMTKHAINSYLALSVVFANELAVLCEQVGADAHEVARCLKSEQRIGKYAYVSPGSAFAGGTLARDVRFLEKLSDRFGKTLPLIRSILPSNEGHKRWVEAKLTEVLGSVKGKTVAVLGLTYKPNTSTLRRSSSVETCKALAALGATVRAYDPGVEEAAGELSYIKLAHGLEDCILGADAIVMQTPWDQFKEISADLVKKAMQKPVVVDPNGFLAKAFETSPGVAYYAIGKNRVN